MEAAQTAKRRRPTISITIIRRQNLSEKEILLLYIAEEKGSPNIT
jgi:hypothetical protein